MDEWISGKEAADWLVSDYGLSVGAAEKTLSEAVAAGNVRRRGWLGNLPGPVPILPDMGVGVLFLRNGQINFADLQWQIERLLDKPAATTKPAGMRTNRAEEAESSCLLWLRGLPVEPRIKRPDALVTAREEFGPNLSDTAFGRCWAIEAPKKGWTRQGRPKKNP
jgi:hypothetical protein